METPKLIYHLIAFPTIYMEGRKRLREIEDARDVEARKAFRDSKEGFYQTIGGHYRGSYLDKQELIKRIEESTDVYDLNEGWYDYLLIETHYLNTIDGCHFDAPLFTESEMWFKFNTVDIDGAGNASYQYEHIPRPECLTGVCGFL